MGKSWALRNSSTLEKSFGFQHRFFLPYTLVNFATFCSLFFPSYKWRFLIQRRKNSRLNSGLKSFAGKSKKYRRCWLELCCKTLPKQLRERLSAKCFSTFDRAVIEQASKRLKIELVRESISYFVFFSLTSANVYHPLVNRIKIQWIPRKHLRNRRRIPWKKHSAKHDVLFSPCLGWEKWKKKKWLEPWSTGTGVFFSQESSGFHDDFHCSLYTYRRSDGARSRRKASCVGRAIPWRPLAFFIVLYSFSTTAVFSIPFQPPSVYRVFQKLRPDEYTRVFQKSLTALAVPFLNFLIL